MKSKTENQMIDEAVKAYTGELKPQGCEIHKPGAHTVTDEDIRIAAAAGLELPAGATPEQRENFEKLRKIAMQKSGK